jgi:hypothetical protein
MHPPQRKDLTIFRSALLPRSRTTLGSLDSRPTLNCNHRRGGDGDEGWGSLLLDESGGVAAAPPLEMPLFVQSDPCPAAAPILSDEQLLVPEVAPGTDGRSLAADVVRPASALCIAPLLPLLS